MTGKGRCVQDDRVRNAAFGMVRLTYFSGSKRFVYQISTESNYDVNDFASLQVGMD